MQQDESQLVQGCLDKKPTAWENLVARYGRLVYSVPIRYGLSAEDAEEVFQNVFVNVFRSLSGLRKQGSLAAWLITIAHRESCHVIKRLRHTVELDESIDDPQPPALEVVQRWERQDAVRHALEQLDPHCRELLTILFLENPSPSYEKIAERLKIPVGSIGPNRGRCIKKLEMLLVSMQVDLG